MTIRFEDLKPGSPEQAKPTGTVHVIVKVRKAGYVPSAVKLRARIDEYLFTAEVDAHERHHADRSSERPERTRAKGRIRCGPNAHTIRFFHTHRA